MKHNQKGFSAVEGLLLLIIIGLIGFVGWYVYNAGHKTPVASNTSVTTTPQSKKTTLDIKLREYKNTDYGFSFSYPSDWIYKVEQADYGRGLEEGEASVTSPNGTVVVFRFNQGGKGGDCGDDEAPNFERTARSCNTVDTLKVEKLASGTKGKSLYAYQAKVTPPTRDNKPVYYHLGIASDKFGAPTVGSSLVDIVGDTILVKGGDIAISFSGKDDVMDDGQAFFDTTEVKEAMQIFKSVRLL